MTREAKNRGLYMVAALDVAAKVMDFYYDSRLFCKAH